ncbi:MAG: hypothetical protein HDT21_12065 [Ruminococcus sp.]|nr:hypothetical protein [Ruminococcus sp.]
MMFSIHPFAELLNDMRLRARGGDFAVCGRRPGALPRGPRSLERLANFLHIGLLVLLYFTRPLEGA